MSASFCNKEEERLQRQHPHALLCPLPAQGHVNPFLNLAVLLTSKGIAVTFICAEHRISPLRGDASLLANPLIRLLGLPERVTLGDIGIDQGFDGLIWGGEVADNMKDDFVEFVKLCHQNTAPDQNFGPPDCIIGDPFVYWTKTVASDLGLPLYTFFTSPAWALTAMIHIPILTSQGLIPLRSSAQPQLMSLPGLPSLWDTDFLHYMLDVVPAGIRRMVSNCAMVQSQSSRILLNTTYEIEAGNIDALEKEDPYKTNLKILTIGPLLSHELLDEDRAQLSVRSEYEISAARDCLEWLNTRSPASVLYVSFGSMHNPSEDEIIELAHGLEASTRAFLWVLRPPPSDTSQDASSWLSRVLPQGFQSRTHDRGFILPRWAPQILILSNPSVGGFWTHCGWNSILESICCGVPLIAYPQFAEQRHNCRMIVDQLKIAREIVKDEMKGFPERKAVERAVRSVMEGEEAQEIRRKVEEVRDTMRRAVKENGSSDRNVELIVKEIFNSFHQRLGATT
ncbi:hypothetical protein O6H91_10G093200 [Diphasiastrum complanatum]|nr:hypothetical protein O6H91_10G093200 [Diphasiastrum complanatum]